MKCICRHCGESVYPEPKTYYYCYECDKELQQDELIADWNLEARMKQLAAMHELMCQANNEFIYLEWIGTVPDEATEEDFKDIALDDELYNECFDLFVQLIAKKGNRW